MHERELQTRVDESERCGGGQGRRGALVEVRLIAFANLVQSLL